MSDLDGVPMSNSQSGSLAETIKTVAYAVVIALGVRSFAFEPFNIPSGSMIPTLLIGDYLFVSKFSYGYSRYSLPLGINLFSGRLLAKEPERGDVAVFRKPKENKVDYIKRVIGRASANASTRTATATSSGRGNMSRPCPTASSTGSSNISAITARRTTRPNMWFPPVTIS